LSESAKTKTDETRYLLGDLSEGGKTGVEDEFFADDAKFEAVELAEDELIDAYVRSELSSEEERQFKAKLFHSRRLVERLNFARALAERADSFLSSAPRSASEPSISFSSPPAKPTIKWWRGFIAQPQSWGIALSACAGLILVAGIILLSGWLRLRSESERLTAAQVAVQHQKDEFDRMAAEQGTRDAQLNVELQREKDKRAEDLKLIAELQLANEGKEAKDHQTFLSTFATVFLTPGSARSGGQGQSELRISPKTTIARIQLGLEKNEYSSYNAAINADGVEVFRKNGLKPHITGSGSQLLLSHPSQRLASGEYIVHVEGVTASGKIESVNDYVFRVVKTNF
jgi:hypothetical protein